MKIEKIRNIIKNSVISNGRLIVNLPDNMGFDEIVLAFNSHEELLNAAKEALSELEPTTSDKPGYYANPEQVERLRKAIEKAEK